MSHSDKSCRTLVTGFAGVAELPCKGVGEPGCFGSFPPHSLCCSHVPAASARAGDGAAGTELLGTLLWSYQA